MDQIKKRYYLIDVLRGLALVNMVLYHGIYDLVVIYGVPMNWYTSKVGYIWQQYICWSFIFISGISWSLGKNPKKRGIQVFLFGAIISVVTLFAMPNERVLGGVLTFIGLAMLLVIPLDNVFKKVKPEVGITISGLCFVLFLEVNNGYLGFEGIKILKLPQFLYETKVGWIFGFPDSTFYSSDYFSILPWFFLYVAGYFAFKLIKTLELRFVDVSWLFIRCKPLEVVGRHSLLIYMLHQPLLMGICILLNHMGIIG